MICEYGGGFVACCMTTALYFCSVIQAIHAVRIISTGEFSIVPPSVAPPSSTSIAQCWYGMYRAGSREVPSQGGDCFQVSGCALDWLDRQGSQGMAGITSNSGASYVRKQGSLETKGA